MPTYLFKNNSGDTLERLVPLGTKTITEDGVKFHKEPNIQGFAFTGRALGVPPQKDQVRDGYYKLEREKGSRFLDRSPFTVKQIKKAWEI